MNLCNAPPDWLLLEDVATVAADGGARWRGRLRLPNRPKALSMLIFQLDDELRAVPALCPHQGYDLTHCALRDGASLLCPAHGLRIALTSTGYAVKTENGRFWARVYDTACRHVIEHTQADGQLTLQHEPGKLQLEIEHLRLANLKQERQILVITQTMDAMLSHSEQQKTLLKEKADQQQALNRFVDSILNNMENLLFVIDQHGMIKRINATVSYELGFSEAELLDSCFDTLLPQATRQTMAAALPLLPWPVRSVLLENVRLSGRYSAEHVLLHKHYRQPESIYWLNCNLLYSAQGKLEGAVLTALNINELKKREAMLRLSNKVFDNTCEAIYITDPHGDVIEVNNAFCTITGYERNAIIGQNTRFLKSHVHDQTFYFNLWQALIKHGFWKGEIWNRRKDGRLCPLLLSISSVYNEQNRLTHYVAIAADISQQKQNEQALEKLAYYDVLTLLPNRTLFKDRLEQEILMAQRHQQQLALFFLDLDHFKNINDTLGHWAGDCLLQNVAERIQSCVRKSDTVARLSGDEFTIILPGLSGISIATELAQKLITAMDQPVQIKDNTVYVGVSIGIAIYPDDGLDFDTLTRHADTAMYASKIKGRGSFQYFEAGMNQAASQRLLLESALRQAIERREFVLYYQPQADCQSQRVNGAEALIRWQRPGFGMMPPDGFIPVAEETALIIPLGAWILKTACLQAKAWAALRPEFCIAVNLSPRQLLADGFIGVLDQVLAETGVNPRNIELEVTESLVMHDTDKARARLLEIRARGFSVAMDDFGTGYSSLSYLTRLPIHTLKIDRSFVQAYASEADVSQAAFLKTIVSLGQALDMTVVAEGVETEAQLALLATYGCQMFQGYYLSKPLPAEEFQRQWLDTL